MSEKLTTRELAKHFIEYCDCFLANDFQSFQEKHGYNLLKNIWLQILGRHAESIAELYEPEAPPLLSENLKLTPKQTERFALLIFAKNGLRDALTEIDAYIERDVRGELEATAPAEPDWKDDRREIMAECERLRAERDGLKRRIESKSHQINAAIGSRDEAYISRDKAMDEAESLRERLDALKAKPDSEAIRKGMGALSTVRHYHHVRGDLNYEIECLSAALASAAEAIETNT